MRSLGTPTLKASEPLAFPEREESSGRAAVTPLSKSRSMSIPKSPIGERFGNCSAVFSAFPAIVVRVIFLIEPSSMILSRVFKPNRST